MQDYLNDATTIPANLAGIPGLSLPIGTAAEDGLPVGLQLLAPTYEDARLYRVGAAAERLIEARDGAPFWAQAPSLAAASTGKAAN
jgi:aspartyl-tRNA(Asn)/glutamyl-tRNA(Gln) amidotransferase subunit A